MRIYQNRSIREDISKYEKSRKGPCLDKPMPLSCKCLSWSTCKCKRYGLRQNPVIPSFLHQLLRRVYQDDKTSRQILHLWDGLCIRCSNGFYKATPVKIAGWRHQSLILCSMSRIWTTTLAGNEWPWEKFFIDCQDCRYFCHSSLHLAGSGPLDVYVNTWGYKTNP